MSIDSLGNQPYAIREARRALAAVARVAAIPQLDHGVAWWVVDADWTELRERNAAADVLFGLHPLSELADVYATFPAEDRALLGEIAERGGSVPQHTIRRRDGDVRVAVTTAIRLASGEIAFLSVDVTDHTRDQGALREALDTAGRERDDAIAAARAAQQRVDVLAEKIAALEAEVDVEQRAKATATDALSRYEQSLARIVHDLRAPLNTILGFTELLQRDEADPDRIRWLGHMDDAGHHLLDTADLLLELVRAEGRRVEPQIVEVDLTEAVLDAASVIRHDAHRRDITLTVDVPTELAVSADPRCLAHVLTNLLSNAAAYTPDGGQVTVAGRSRGRRVVLSVTDSGPGISRDALSSIFEPFQRGDGDRRGHRGAGLGLAICREYVEAMNGSIGAYNSAHAGATFWVELPSTQSATGSRPIVLAATTDEALAELIDGALGERIEVRIVRSGRGLVRAVDGSAATTVIVSDDLGSAAEVASTIAQVRSSMGPSTPIAFLSPTDAEVPGGVTCHLTTPLRLDALRQVVQSTMGGSG